MMNDSPTREYKHAYSVFNEIMKKRKERTEKEKHEHYEHGVDVQVKIEWNILVVLL